MFLFPGPFQAAKAKAAEVKERAAGTAEEVKERAAGAAEEAKERATAAGQAAKERAGELAESGERLTRSLKGRPFVARRRGGVGWGSCGQG